MHLAVVQSKEYCRLHKDRGVQLIIHARDGAAGKKAFFCFSFTITHISLKYDSYITKTIIWGCHNRDTFFIRFFIYFPPENKPPTPLGGFFM